MQSRLKKTAIAASLAVLSSPILVNAQQANLGSWSILPVQQMVTCIHSFIVPGPGVPGTDPKLVCVERPHSGGSGKYPPNKYTERANSAEVQLNAAAGTPMSTYAKKSNSITNPFCGGHAQMADGNIFMAGGDKEIFNDPVTGAPMLTDGTTARRVYTPYDSNPKNGDPWTTVTSDMKGRWYPTVITMHDERQFIVSGTSRALDLLEWANKNFTINPTYEYYNNGQSTSPVELQILKDNDPWNLYPFVAQMPQSGNLWIFVGGPSILLNPDTQAITELPKMLDDKHHPRIYPFTPTVVMLPLTVANNYQATMMVCGGTFRDYGGKTTNTTSTGPGSYFCSRVDPESKENNKWNENHVQFAGSEADGTGQGKVMPDVVLMPDGKVLWVNGATWGTAGGDAGVVTNAHNPSYTTQIFDPEVSKFTKGPDFKVARLYHSGALLLPDGRIITTGNEEANWADLDVQPSKVLANQCFPFTGPLNNRSSVNNTASANCGDPFEYRIEAYSPGYLSLPNPPKISAGHGTSYPASITYGSNFVINFDTDATQIRNISFVRYATTTHSTNTDQRFVELKILFKDSKRVFVDAPKNGFIAPPGNWMLFPVAKNGAVGHSVTIKLGKGAVTKVDVPNASISAVRVNVFALVMLAVFGVFMMM